MKTSMLPWIVFSFAFLIMIVAFIYAWEGMNEREGFCESRGEKFMTINSQGYCTIERQDSEGNIYYEKGTKLPDKFK